MGLDVNCFAIHFAQRPSALRLVPASHLLVKNSSLNCFFITRNPLGFKSQTKKQDNLKKVALFLWSWRWDLNPRPADYESAALPTVPLQPNAVDYISKRIKMQQKFLKHFVVNQPKLL